MRPGFRYPFVHLFYLYDLQTAKTNNCQTIVVTVYTDIRITERNTTTQFSNFTKLLTVSKKDSPVFQHYIAEAHKIISLKNVCHVIKWNKKPSIFHKFPRNFYKRKRTGTPCHSHFTAQQWASKLIHSNQWTLILCNLFHSSMWAEQGLKK